MIKTYNLALPWLPLVKGYTLCSQRHGFIVECTVDTYLNTNICSFLSNASVFVSLCILSKLIFVCLCKNVSNIQSSIVRVSRRS